MAAVNPAQRPPERMMLRPPQLLSLMLSLMLVITLAMVLGADSHVTRPLLWAALLVQAAIAGLGGWLLNRKVRQAQLQRQKEAQRSQALLDRLSIATQAAGIYCWELDWNTYSITWDESRLPANEAAAASRRHFGMELGSDLFKYVHPEDEHAGGKAMAESLARGEDHVSFRYRLVLPDGSIRHVQAFARTYTDAAGKPLRSLGVSWDVTAEVEAAQRAARDAAIERQLLERLSVATQAAGLQSWEFDFREGRVTWLNTFDPAEGTPEAIKAAGEAMLAQLLPEDREAVLGLTAETTRRGDPMMSTHFRRRDADGSVRDIQMYQRFFYDANGEPVRALGANLDITESFRRQAELEALSIRFSIATRAVQAGVWEWWERDDKVWWNEMMYTIYGCSPETFRPHFSELVRMIHPDDLPHAQEAWDNVLNGTEQLQVQFRVRRRDGSIVHLEQVAVLVTDAQTSSRRLVGITLDISNRVAAEQRERLLQRKLREASHQSGMAEVATGVLHNVGNVLNSLGVAASTVQMRLKTSPIDRVERVSEMLRNHRGALAEFLTNNPRGQRVPEYLAALGAELKRENADLLAELAAIGGHVQYLAEIVQAQQTFARVGSAEEAIDVRELAETALTLKGRELRGIEIRREIPEKMPEVLADPYKLLQILVNFIGNACDAMAANPEERPRRMTLRAQIVDGQLEIAVEDTGVGIARDLVPRIWEFGFTTKAHGHGFGLHSSAVAAQQLGGTIAAESAGVNQGACFRLRIPVGDSHAREDSAAQTAVAG